MTERTALTKIRKHVTATGGKADRVSIERRTCKPWSKDDPRNRRGASCDSFDHPKDCPAGVTVCSMRYLRLTSAGSLGTIGFTEIVGRGSTWEDVIAEVEQRRYW